MEEKRGEQRVAVSARQQKVYQGVLREIRLYIDEHQLAPGDKLPSERELADKLGTGRSSIREALRSLELLGLIETRHGEGTFLSVYQSYQTVELLSSFILRENNTGNDLVFVKALLEKEAAKLAFRSMGSEDTGQLTCIIDDPHLNLNEKHTAFFKYILAKTNSLLLEKMWQLMEEFSHTIHNPAAEPLFYTALIHLYAAGDYEGIEKLFDDENKK